MATRSRRLSPSKRSCAAKTKAGLRDTRSHRRHCPRCRFAALCVPKNGASLPVLVRFDFVAHLVAEVLGGEWYEHYTKLLAHGSCFEPILPYAKGETTKLEERR